jgi:hypothetical protein
MNSAQCDAHMAQYAIYAPSADEQMPAAEGQVPHGMRRHSAVETERGFVRVVVQMLRADRALVSVLLVPLGGQWRTKSEYAKLPFLMAVKFCRVTVTDLEGITHTVQVTATTLYEAVALGLAAVRGHEWVAGIPEGPNTIRVSVTSMPVEHAVTVRDFTRWLERKGGSPREVTDRDRVRAILGLPCASA